MSPSAALDIIRLAKGPTSTQYKNACILSAYGRHADIIAQAAAIIGARKGRILSIAA